MMHLILLAAGSSSRFGGNKLLYPIDGKPMYRHVLDRLIRLQSEFGNSLTVVARQGPLSDALRGQALRLVLNPDPGLGISGSIRRGIAALPEDGAPAAFFVADQPCLREATIRGFIEAYLRSGRALGCVAHGGEPGNPAAFSRSFFPQLLALEGDRGGKGILRAHMDECLLFEVADANELRDIDIPPTE